MPKTTRISALLPLNLVEEVKKISIEKNITQSSIIKKALESFIINKLDKDTKKLAKIKFTDLPKEEDWDLIQSKI